MKNKFGFTLMEIMIVVVIVGILASIALPSFLIAIEKAKSQDGITLIRSAYVTQRTHQMKLGNYAAAVDDAEFEKTSNEHFNATLSATENSCASAVRINSADFIYTFTLDCATGKIKCSDATSPKKICQTLANGETITAE